MVSERLRFRMRFSFGEGVLLKCLKGKIPRLAYEWDVLDSLSPKHFSKMQVEVVEEGIYQLSSIILGQEQSNRNNMIEEPEALPLL